MKQLITENWCQNFGQSIDDIAKKWPTHVMTKFWCASKSVSLNNQSNLEIDLTQVSVQLKNRSISEISLTQKSVLLGH